MDYRTLEPTIDVSAADTVVDIPATLAALDRHFSKRGTPLAPPLSDAQIAKLEAELPCPLPPLLKAMYRWHDGVEKFEYGYDWLSLSRLVAESKQWRGYPDPNWRKTYLPLLMLDSEEYLVLDCAEGARPAIFRYFVETDELPVRYRGPGHWLAVTGAAYDNGGYRYDPRGFIDPSPLLLVNAFEAFENEGERAARERNWTRIEPELRSATGMSLQYLVQYENVLADERALPILRDRLRDPATRPEDRAMLSYALGNLRDRESQSDLASNLTDNAPEVRDLAALALARTGPIESSSMLDRLIAQLDDIDDLARISAIEALGASGSPRAVQPLVRALPMSRSGLQRYIVDALVLLGDKSALPALKQLQSQLANDDLSAESKGASRGSDVVPKVLKAAVDKAIADLGG